MSKPIIALDFDDVIFPTSRLTIDFYNKTYGTSLTMDHAYTYANPDLWLADHTTVLERVNSFASDPETMHIPPIDGAIDAILNLTGRYSFVLITGRAASVKGFTAQWLKAYFGDIFVNHIFIEELQENVPDISKLDVCKTLGCAYLIDDTPLHLLGFGADLPRGVLFGEYPWSSTVKLSKGVKWCRNWQAVKEYFDGIS